MRINSQCPVANQSHPRERALRHAPPWWDRVKIEDSWLWVFILPSNRDIEICLNRRSTNRRPLSQQTLNQQTTAQRETDALHNLQDLQVHFIRIRALLFFFCRQIASLSHLQKQLCFSIRLKAENQAVATCKSCHANFRCRNEPNTAQHHLHTVVHANLVFFQLNSFKLCLDSKANRSFCLVCVKFCFGFVYELCRVQLIDSN